jgi:putative colanic acid biosynthesis acetyltransferase WcaB
MSLYDCYLLQDYAQNKHKRRLRLLLVFFRLAQLIEKYKKNRWLAWLVVYSIFYRIFSEWFLGIELRPGTKVGRGLVIDHGYSLVVNQETTIGRNVRLRHGVTIGCKVQKDGSQGPSPILGDWVDIGAGAIILGGITLGDCVKVGAGSVVVNDVPPGVTVAGNPARPIMGRK